MSDSVPPNVLNFNKFPMLPRMRAPVDGRVKNKESRVITPATKCYNPWGQHGLGVEWRIIFSYSNVQKKNSKVNLNIFFPVYVFVVKVRMWLHS